MWANVDNFLSDNIVLIVNTKYQLLNNSHEQCSKSHKNIEYGELTLCGINGWAMRRRDHFLSLEVVSITNLKLFR